MKTILDEASGLVEKTANDDNGAPDTKPDKQNQQTESTDVLSAATNLLKGIEEFKSSLTGATAQAGAAPEQQVEPSQNEAQPTEVAPEPTVSGTQTTIQTPGGSIIKLAMTAWANMSGEV